MSTPPPPPPGQNPPPYNPGGQQPYGQPYQQAPMGYQQYGMQPGGQQRNNGLSVASLVLGLVNIIPCFWLFPLPAVLAVIFGFVGRGQIKKDPTLKGNGLALAGLILGLIFVAIGVIFWVYVATNGHCVRDGSSFNCSNLNN